MAEDGSARSEASTMLTTAGLAAAAAVHQARAAGSTWPAPDPDRLADVVVGRRPLPSWRAFRRVDAFVYSPLCLSLALGALHAAGALDADGRRRQGRPRARTATAAGLTLARLGGSRAVPVTLPPGLVPGITEVRVAPACRLPLGGRTVTVGDVLLTSLSVQGLASCRGGRLLAHEARHVVQWRRHGSVGFVARYAVACAVSLLRTGDAARGNALEVEAGLADGGYD